MRKLKRNAKFLAGTAAAIVVMAVPGTAFASSCANVSRSANDPAPCGFTCTSLVTQGNWVWLPSLAAVGVPGPFPPLWGFAPPGTPDAQLFGAPGAGGNYTNGQTGSLLGVSNNCPPGNNPNRQTTNGIQSGCAAG